MSDRFHYAYQPRNVLGRTTLYMNWGLWEDDTRELDDAAVALVRRLGEMAGLGPETRLLDVGFGFGDQLMDWVRLLDLGSAEGINLCPEQTAFTARRLRDSGLVDRIHVQVGDALEVPFADQSFDAVTALECAFHFRSREAFFAEAHRVLRPGGRLALADFIHSDDPSRLERLGGWLAASLWRFSDTGWTVDDYARHLENAGFHDISIEVVTDRVVRPGISWARRRIWEAELRARMTRRTWSLTLGLLMLSQVLGDPSPGEYVLVGATR